METLEPVYPLEVYCMDTMKIVQKQDIITAGQISGTRGNYLRFSTVPTISKV